MMGKRLFLLVLMLVSLIGVVQAQDGALAPPEITGEAVYVPFPVEITVDGDPADWSGVPLQTVERGTMLSSDAANNGSFSFALASSGDMLYVLMTSVDANIITGQHDANYWNEDSLEFYLNLTDNLGAASYTDGIFQVNVNPGDMGNTDPATLTITGTNGAQAQVTGYVFATEDGWGFEAEVPLPFTPQHGREIGFQAHANGSTGGDRDVKLIWSLADGGDSSWQNPSVFGRAIFFEVGSSDIPLPSAVVTEPTAAPTTVPSATPDPIAQSFISVNQTGYFPNATKLAVYATSEVLAQPAAWALIDISSGETVADGATLPSQPDRPSGDFINGIDFSSFTTPGNYRLEVSGATSVPFRVGSDIYNGLAVDALRYFYLNRSGIELDAEHAQTWARPAGHMSDSSVTCFRGTDPSGQTWDGCDYKVDAGGGWYDAGDYGKYVVNGGIAAWTLMNSYEFNPQIFPDTSLNIPESGDGLADVLDEARWEMNFMLGMQVPEGEPQAGMAFHKLHALQWDGLPALPPTETSSGNERFVMPPSTAATLNLAATAAQCARIWRTLDAEYADRCLNAAARAWQAANENPVFTYGSIPGGSVGGGDYNDATVTDEFFWAAAELYVTTGEQVYHDFLVTSPHFTATGDPDQVGSVSWGDVDVLGLLTLALYPDGLSTEEQATVRDQIVRIADYDASLTDVGYRMAMSPNGYVWGSNSGVLNNAMLLAYAYRLTDEQRYLNAAVQSMDYILGRNGLNFSFVSGYGTYAMQHPHHRFWADQPEQGYPSVPPGALAGGPNAIPADPPAQAPEIAGRAPAKRYIDDIDSYSTNEVAINWNAPLAWVAAFLDAQYAGE